MGTIYSNTKTTKYQQGGHNTGSKFKYNRPDLLDEDIASELNTYRNWGIFKAETQPFTLEDGDKYYEHAQTKSLFNNVASVGYNSKYAVLNNAPLIDWPNLRLLAKKNSACGIKDLVKASEEGQLGRAVYSYADFMYCKDLGRVSNNYLITLRRFPYPCGDHIGYNDYTNQKEVDLQQHMPAIGRMVTWLGANDNTLENILKYKFSMPFKEMTAEIQDVDAQGDQGGLLGNLMNLGGNSAYQKQMLQGTAGGGALAGITQGMTSVVPGGGRSLQAVSGAMSNPDHVQAYRTWASHRDNTKVYGEIDAVKKTYIRSDEGLQFENKFTLTFDYEMKSYDGINGKAAFLDLIANILVTCYTSGTFWGGGYRGTGASQSNVFANLPIFKMTPPVGFSKLSSAIVDSSNSIKKDQMGGQASSGNGLKDALSMLKNFGEGLKNMLLGGVLNLLGRPHKMALNSLLSPAPVGLWHIVIGNPKRPILTMGNMILLGTEITQYGPLGLDDFPTGIRVKCEFTHGKPRDSMQIEQMYLGGDFRIYQMPDQHILDMYDNAYSLKSRPISKTSIDSDGNVLNTTVGKDGKESTKVVANMSGASVEEIANTNTASGDLLKNPAIEINPDKKKILTKFFGTDNTQNIVWAAKEAAFGSDKKKKNSTGKSGKAN